MFTFRNLLAVAVPIFGSTFLWMMPLFIGPTATGPLWMMAQGLGFLAIIGFVVAAWGIFKVTIWWESTTLAPCVVGIAAIIPYALAAPVYTGGGVRTGDHDQHRTPRTQIGRLDRCPAGACHGAVDHSPALGKSDTGNPPGRWPHRMRAR